MKIILLLICVAMLQMCREKPVDNDEPKLGKRNYKWSIDSIDYDTLPTTVQIQQMWGSSATDVWGVAGDAPDVRDCLWHYDGTKWRRATYNTPITEFTGNKTVYAIYGGAKNDVWTFGRKINNNVLSAFIMHYDGTRWSDVTPSNVAALCSILYNVYGVSKNDIWVGGYEYALHYDGSAWNAHKVADSMIVGSITGYKNFTYFFLGSPWGKNTIYISVQRNQEFDIVDSTKNSYPKFGGGLWIVDSNLNSLLDGVITTKIFSNGDIDKNGWKREFTAYTSFKERFIQSTNNIFVVGAFNLIYHYNGQDWKQISIVVLNHSVPSNAFFWGNWADGKEVFICDWNNGIIYHGK